MGGRGVVLMQRFAALDDYQAHGPVLALCSTGRRLYAACLGSTEHVAVPLTSGRSAVVYPEVCASFVHGNGLWMVAGTNAGLIYVQDRRGRWLPPVQLTVDESVHQINAVYVRADTAFVAVGRFVVRLDLPIMAQALKQAHATVAAPRPPLNPQPPVPLDPAWGGMHALHTEDVHALYMLTNGLLVSGGDDGLVMLTQPKAFTPIKPALIIGEAEAADDEEQDDDNLMIFCVGVSDCVRQFWVGTDDMLTILTHTGRIASYRVGGITALSQDQIDLLDPIIPEPSSAALDIGKRHLWACACGRGPEACTCDEPGAIEVVCIFEDTKRACALVSHTSGRACVVSNLHTPEPTLETLIEGIDAGQPKCAVYSKPDNSLVIGTECGRIYRRPAASGTGSQPY